MPNSKTKHSQSLRALVAQEWVKNKRKEGQIKQINIVFRNIESIEKLNKIKISKVKFFEKALELLDENGNIKE